MEHRDPFALEDMVANLRHFCPLAELWFYNSGTDPSLGKHLDIAHVPNPKPYQYAKIVSWFIELFEWVTNHKIEFDYLINMETDLLFIREGFEAFISETMDGYDYMAPNLELNIAKTSKWRPYHSLKPELNNWLEFWETPRVNGAFSPAQVFSQDYVHKLLGHVKYSRLLELLEENESFTLQEVLFPTLPNLLGLKARSYPRHLKSIIRYRPYQAVVGVEKALATLDAYFVHPVHRAPENPARQRIKALYQQSEQRKKQSENR